MDLLDPRSARLVADAVKERREHLGMRQEDITAAGGPSKALMYQLESGATKSYQDVKIANLEKALRWSPGSVKAVRDGQQPSELSEAPSPEIADEVEPTTLTWHGWTITIKPTSGAPRVKTRQAEQEFLTFALQKLQQLGLDEE